MRILALWVVNYHSGSTSERFIKPLEDLGATVEIIPLESGNIEYKLMSAVNSEDYDMLLHLPYPGLVRMEVIKHLPIPTVAWCGDDEWMWMMKNSFAKEIAKSHTHCITTYKPALQNYPNGILASWGYPDDWRPKKCKKDIDIYFCGSKTPIRDQYIEVLKDSGFKIVVDGPGYSGKVPLETMIDRYRHAKIGLSFVSESKDGFVYQQVKARTFEIPACGTFQLSEYCPQLLNYFSSKKEIDTFFDERSLIDKCKYYLSHEKEREVIAHKGYLRGSVYSYKNIFKLVFKQIEESYAKA